MKSSALRTIDFLDMDDGSFSVEPKTYQKIHLRQESPLELMAGGPLNANISMRERHKQLAPVPKISVTPLQRNFQLIQQWEGVVKAVSSDAFTCVIKDKTNSDNFDEEVEIDTSEVPEGDLHLLRPGSWFYWSIGYESGPGLPRQRVSRIRFKRLAGLSWRQLEKARSNAHKISSLFA